MSAVTQIKKTYTSSHEELEVYKRAFALSLAVHKASLEFPKMEQYALADQIRRASKSICANIAEGYAKQSFSVAEFKRFLGMAIGSCAECRVWLDYCFALGYIDQHQCAEWKEGFSITERMLGKLRFNVTGNDSNSKPPNLQTSKSPNLSK